MAAAAAEKRERALIGADLERRWNPNCAVEGGADVNLTVQVVLTAQGRVVGRPQVIEQRPIARRARIEKIERRKGIGFSQRFGHTLRVQIVG